MRDNAAAVDARGLVLAFGRAYQYYRRQTKLCLGFLTISRRRAKLFADLI
jgi:hypothetical protein